MSRVPHLGAYHEIVSTRMATVPQVIQWIASLMITVVAFAMLKFYNLERKWRYKLEKGVSAEVSWGIGGYT